MIRIHKTQDSDLDVRAHLTIGEDVFERAKEYFDKEYFESGSREGCGQIMVSDRSGEPLFALEAHPDKLYNVDRKGTAYELARSSDEESMDLLLFEDIDVAVFYELEEYTYRICRSLQKRYPDMSQVFLDKNAALVLEGVRICEDLLEAQSYAGEKKCMYITSDGLNAVGPGKIPDHRSRIYNSINVMYSLIWVQKHSCYGQKNSGKTIFLIDTAIDDVGLVDVIKLVCYYKNVAEDHGWIPVVKLDRFPNQYLRKETENMWEYFFLPVSKVSVADAMESADVISMRENKQIFHQVEINPFVRKYAQIMTDNSFLRSNFSLNKEVCRYVRSHIPVQCMDGRSRVLGVIMRGTDYRRAAVLERGEADINALPDAVISRIYELDRVWRYDRIFVATEDEEYLGIFKREFGDKMIALEQKRAHYDDSLAKRSVSELLGIKGDIDFAKQYLTVIYTLSKCNGLLVSRNCGASRLARSWNEDRYEVDEVVGKRK